MKTNIFFKTAFMLAAILLNCNIHTCAQEWKWAKTIDSALGSCIIGSSYVDDEGNVYITGYFDKNAIINHNEHDPVIPGAAYEGGWTGGAFVAKMGADGEFIWRKVTSFRNFDVYSNASAGGAVAVFKEDAIYVMTGFGYSVSSNFNPNGVFRFFDEDITGAEILATNPPFMENYWNALLKFSYDGEVLEKHFIQMKPRDFAIDYDQYLGFFVSSFHVDNSGNTYIYTVARTTSMEPSSATAPFVLKLDNETIYNFYIPKDGWIAKPIIIKLGPDWQVKWVKQIFHNIVDNHGSFAYDPDTRMLSVSFDEEDNMYLSGLYLANYADNFYYPINIYLDNTGTNKIVVDSETAGFVNGYIIKYDTNGNVKWSNQIYSVYSKEINGSAISDNAVFVLGYCANTYTSPYFSNLTYFLNSNGDTVKVISPCPTQKVIVLVAKFDKTTGHYIAHDVIPNEEYSSLYGYTGGDQHEPALINNHIVVSAHYGMPPQNTLLASFRTEDCKLEEVLDTIFFASPQSYPDAGSISGNKNGDILIRFTTYPNTITIGDLPDTYCIYNGTAVFALKNDPRLLPTGIEPPPAADNNGIIIYPNPTNYELKIENYDGKINSIEICDITGRTVGATLAVAQMQNAQMQNAQRAGASPAPTGTTTINVSSLPQGVYLVKIYTDNGVTVEKFIKK